MILHQDYIIKIDYDPATDIMQVNYPDLRNFHLIEIKHSLSLLIDTIRNYDVKKLLLDASKTTIEVTDNENKAMGMQLAADLVRTRLEKVARIQPANPMYELRAQNNIKDIENAGLLTYQLQTFTNKADALNWLRE